jgi:hypothetical protein
MTNYVAPLTEAKPRLLPLPRTEPSGCHLHSSSLLFSSLKLLQSSLAHDKKLSSAQVNLSDI